MDKFLLLISMGTIVASTFYMLYSTVRYYIDRKWIRETGYNADWHCFFLQIC